MLIVLCLYYIRESPRSPRCYSTTLLFHSTHGALVRYNSKAHDIPISLLFINNPG